MEEINNVVIDDVVVDNEVLDQDNSDETTIENEEENSEVEVPNKPKRDKAQERINELVKQKYELAKQLEDYKNQARENISSENISPEIMKSLIEEEAYRIASEQSFNKRCDDIFQEGIKASESFQNDIITLNQMGFGNTYKEFFDEVVSSDAPVEIIQYLSEDLDRAEEIFALPIKKAIKLIAKLESDLKNKPKNIKPVSKAPPPITPLGGKPVKPAVTPEKDVKAWIAQRNKELSYKR